MLKPEKRVKMNLQMFAEPPTDPPKDPDPPKEPPNNEPNNEPKLFSEDYVKSLRSEAAENRVKAKQLKEAIEKTFNIELDGDITEALTKVKTGYETQLTETQQSVKAMHLNTEATRLQAELGIIDLEAAMKLADLSKVEITEDGKVDGMEEALKAVLEAKPYLKGTASPTKPPVGGNPTRGENQENDGVAEALERARAKNMQGSLQNDPWAGIGGQGTGQSGVDPDTLAQSIAKALQGLTQTNK